MTQFRELVSRIAANHVHFCAHPRQSTVVNMVDDIGVNLREIRADRGLSLRQLAVETGLSATLLSQVERGIAEPSLKTLRALSRVFGDSVAQLFSSPTPIILHLSRPGERSRISSPAGQIQYERLTPNNGQIEVLRGTLTPGDWSSDEAWSHEAIECIYVIDGQVIVEVDGQELIVQAGESATFSSLQAHRYGNRSQETATFILSVSPPTP